jgi:voltage-gated potassium channel
MNNQSFKVRLYEIIFESDTPAGKGFDVLLIISILLSVIVVLLDSVQFYNNKYGNIHSIK